MLVCRALRELPKERVELHAVNIAFSFADNCVCFFSFGGLQGGEGGEVLGSAMRSLFCFVFATEISRCFRSQAAFRVVRLMASANRRRRWRRRGGAVAAAAAAVRGWNGGGVGTTSRERPELRRAVPYILPPSLRHKKSDCWRGVDSTCGQQRQAQRIDGASLPSIASTFFG